MSNAFSIVVLSDFFDNGALDRGWALFSFPTDPDSERIRHRR